MSTIAPSIVYMIATLTRRDLYAIGLLDIDIALLKEADMEEIAAKMQVSYQDNLYYQDLARITFGIIDRKNREIQGIEPTFPVMSMSRSLLQKHGIAESFTDKELEKLAEHLALFYRENGPRLALELRIVVEEFLTNKRD